MKSTHALLASALFALTLLAPPPSEAARGGGGGNGYSGGGHRGGGGGNWNGGGGGRHWNGGGHYRGGHWHGGGHYRGGYYGGGYYRGGYYPYYGFYWAAPFLWGAAYSYPYWGGYWGPSYAYSYPAYPYAEYPAARVYDAVPAPTVDMGPESQVNPAAPGAPAQAPLYMNYCPASKAYYPKVQSCPEGWEFRRPQYQ